ncbi:peptide ABC transporter permease [Wenjunlia vitaminophila]|uniref:Peptide ABC transporter permease n=1 Tax=Wenjunlia vitaminophila TaxID=76728 RepID=A0A0T6LL51_WENVI|nr:ABC transporter permease [Wenjunlia vitaminophila]KRV46572.1 peptide ABC transporter permease [Wenjunlia vitaminophila]
MSDVHLASEAAAAPTAPGPTVLAPSSVWHRLRARPLFWVAISLITLFVLMAAVPSLFTSVDPEDCNLSRSLVGPNGDHWLGTDVQGCDVYARSVHATRASLLIGLSVTVATFLIGVLVGSVAGYFGGIVDAVLSRIIEIFLAIPLLLGATVLLATAANGDGGVLGVIVALSLYGWTQTARIMRASTMETRGLDYIVAARASGASDPRILLEHVIPNAISPVIVVATTNVGLFITYEATISYLGLGLQDSTLSWGQMIHDSVSRFLTSPHALLAPAGFLSLAVLGVLLLGDAMRDAVDPRSRR